MIISIFCNPLLSRGLDYYTGIIIGAEYLEYLDKEVMLSSIAGERYDKMLDKLETKRVIPAIVVILEKN